jgi:hypothetical protein
MYDPFGFYEAWVQWWIEMVFETRALRNFVNIQKDRIDNIDKRLREQGI